jgi:putative transposase
LVAFAELLQEQKICVVCGIGCVILHGMKYDLQSGSHSVHQLQLHIVWCVKYRRTVLTREVGDRLSALLRELCEKADVELLATENEVDHVHIVVRTKPTHQLSKLINSLKGVTARRLFQEFPRLKNRLWGGHLWSPSYFVVTVGGAPLDAIKQYVENQRQG